MKTLEPIIFLLAIIFGCTCKTYSANDLVLTDAKLQSYDLTYQRMPLSQGQGLTFKAYCSNVGSFDHTGVYVNLKIINSFSDTIYNNNSATISVLNSSTDSVEINTPFNASDPGRYTFLYTMYQDSIDDNPSNNIVSIKQDIMEHLFQRDDGNYTGNNSWMGSSSYSEIGNLYEFLSPCIITSASVNCLPVTSALSALVRIARVARVGALSLMPLISDCDCDCVNRLSINFSSAFCSSVVSASSSASSTFVFAFLGLMLV